MSISWCPGTHLRPNIRRSPVYRIAVMWSFSLWSPALKIPHDFEGSFPPCLAYFGIYLVNPQHRQCPAVYTSGRTSSFQQQKHMECPSSDLSLYRSSGTAKHWACLPSVQVPYWVCCAVYHTSIRLLGFRQSPLEMSLWISMPMTYEAHPYPSSQISEECLRIVQQPQITASKQYVCRQGLERETCSHWPNGIYTDQHCFP